MRSSTRENRGPSWSDPEKKGTVNDVENGSALYDPKTRKDREKFFRAFRFALRSGTVEK